MRIYKIMNRYIAVIKDKNGYIKRIAGDTRLEVIKKALEIKKEELYTQGNLLII